MARTEFAFTAFLSPISGTVQNYVNGAVVLARSIRRVTNLDMILLVWGNISNEIVLTHEGWTLCFTTPIAGPIDAVHNRYLEADVYTKLVAWNLTEYSAILMLDLDMMVLSDPTDVFTDVLPRMLAENKEFGAATDRPTADNYPHMITGAFTQWCRPAVDFHTFNAGSMLIVPSTHQFQVLVHGINTIQHNTHWAEQSYLNVVFGSSTFELPFAYNGQAISIVCEPMLWFNAKIVHFVTEKPWHEHSTIDVTGIRPYRTLWEELFNKN
jgi:lipopolysaccharide biosynthesis glycosyltransferase